MRLTVPRLRCWRAYGAPTSGAGGGCGGGGSEAVRRPPEGDGRELRVGELGTDAHEGAFGHETRAHQLECHRALLEYLEQTLVPGQLVRPELAESTGGAADVERLLRSLEYCREGGPDLREEIPLAGTEVRVLEARAQHSSAELAAAESLVEVLPRPFGQSWIDCAGKRQQPLRHPSRRRDDDHHHELRLQKEDLYSPDHRRLEGRRRNEREQMRDLCKGVRRRLQGRLHFASQLGEVQVESDLGGPWLELLDHLVHEKAVAEIGRDSSCRGVRMREQALLLEDCELVTHRRGRPVHRGPLHQRLRADGRTRRDVLLDHAHEDLLLARREHGIRAWRHARSIVVICRYFSEKLNRHATSEKPAAAREEQPFALSLDEPEPFQPGKRFEI